MKGEGNDGGSDRWSLFLFFSFSLFSLSFLFQPTILAFTRILRPVSYLCVCVRQKERERIKKEEERTWWISHHFPPLSLSFSLSFSLSLPLSPLVLVRFPLPLWIFCLQKFFFLSLSFSSSWRFGGFRTFRFNASNFRSSSTHVERERNSWKAFYKKKQKRQGIDCFSSPVRTLLCIKVCIVSVIVIAGQMRCNSNSCFFLFFHQDNGPSSSIGAL